jgi:hypothetical protein
MSKNNFILADGELVQKKTQKLYKGDLCPVLYLCNHVLHKVNNSSSPNSRQLESVS